VDLGVKRAVILLVLAVALLAAAAAGLELGVLGEVVIEGEFDVGGALLEPEEIELDLGVVRDPEGFVVFEDIAVLRVSSGGAMIQFLVEEDELPEGILIVNLLVTLSGEGVEYVIEMPCAAYTGDCVRLEKVIPGYDEPLPVEEGVYRVSVEVSWLAKGRREGDLKITLRVVEQAEG